ncbi:hypothetical protein GW17_00040033, partial [Ensete ventricosum]
YLNSASAPNVTRQLLRGRTSYFNSASTSRQVTTNVTRQPLRVRTSYFHSAARLAACRRESVAALAAQLGELLGGFEGRQGLPDRLTH